MRNQNQRKQVRALSLLLRLFFSLATSRF
eukprot:COSAG05_NODE_19294_length_295_cov_0.464286_2_plen_28_part_01